VRYDSLPGRPFPGDPDSHPARDDVVTYPTDYIREFALPVGLNSAVRSVRRADDDVSCVVELDRAPVEADQVVIATGPFQTPYVPAIADRLDPGIVHLHSTAYRNPAEVPSGSVLVVATRG
jgi:putative flavoprotein involved in K+ transport